MGRPKKSAAAQRELTAGKGKTSVIDAVAQVKGFHELDLNGYSDHYLTHSARTGKNFTAWLDTNGLSLDDLAARVDRINGQPVMDDLVVTLWVATRAETCKTSTSLKNYVTQIALWLRGNGWNTSRLDSTSRTGKKVRQAVDSMCASKPKHIRTQARPYTPKEIDAIIAAIDANSFDWNELTVQAMRTYVTLGFAMAMRGGELCHTLRWDMVDIDAEVFNLPGGKVFKHQDKPATLTVPHNHSPKKTCGTNCPVAVLKAWKATCEDHGVPTVDTLVFPAVRSKLRWDSPKTAAYFGEKAFIADPVAHATALDDDTPKVRTSARNAQHRRYLKLWHQACKAAGIKADHQWQRTSTHGMRRGAATTAVRNGVPETIVSQRLRHNDIQTTSIYIQPRAADTTELSHISQTQNVELNNTPLAEAANLRKTCEVTHAGVTCNRVFYAHINIHSDRMAACNGHYNRHRRGATDASLTSPIRPRKSA